jgi:hypothetical protein
VICLQVNVNGERRLIAGVEAADVINATVSLYPGLKEGWLEVAGLVNATDQPSADARWLGAALAAGDVVEVRMVESGEAAAPTVSHTDPTAPASASIPLVCAFCNRSPQEIEGMLTSRRAAICPECVAYLHDIISGDAKSA